VNDEEAVALLPRLFARVPATGHALALTWSLGLLPRPARRVTVELREGIKLHVDLADGTQSAMFSGTFEARERRELARLLRPGDVMVDVGAHIGLFTLLAASLVGPTGKVFAFEGFPANVRRLRENLALNEFTNVEVQDVVVSDRKGQASIGMQASHDTGSATAGVGALEGAPVRTVFLDDVLPEDIEVDLMKVDVEGLEASVLAGARGTLQRTRALLVELNDSALGRNQTTREAVLAAAHRAGLTRQITLGPLDATRRRLRGYDNVLLIRED
jgi:FkbM family methyltransferase